MSFSPFRPSLPGGRQRVPELAALLAFPLIVVAVIVVLAVRSSSGDGAADTTPTTGRTPTTSSPTTSAPTATPAPAAAAATGDPRAQAEADAVQAARARLSYVAVGGSAGREIALTFDAGPGPSTPAILRALARAGAPATFFQTATDEGPFADDRGSQVANGRYVLGVGVPAPQAQAGALDGPAEAIRAATGQSPTLARSSGAAPDAASRALLGQRGMLLVLWSIDGHDGRGASAGAIARRVLAKAHPGAIVRLHDGGDRAQTVAALPRIVTGLRRRGYRLVTVPRLLADAPPPARQPPPR